MKLLLTGVAALFLATGTAHAIMDENLDWSINWKPCSVTPTDKDSGGLTGIKAIALDLEDIRNLQKFIPELKKCEAWYKCLYDRDIKHTVKHCYANDRRWRMP
jgi:hypothetical protein